MSHIIVRTLATGALVITIGAPAAAQTAAGTQPPASVQQAPLPAPGQTASELETLKARADRLELSLRDWAQLDRYRDENVRLVAAGPVAGRVVFLGDSITDIWQRPQFGGFFPGRSYVNRGISGQNTAQMLIRLRPDVLALQPRVVVILAGTNDIGGVMGPRVLAPIPDTFIEDNLASMAELAALHGTRVVFAALLPVSDYDRMRQDDQRLQTTQRPPERILAINRWLKQYVADHGHVYLDYYSAMVDDKGLLKDELTDDGLHPNAAGYAVMAPLVEKAIAAALAEK